MTAPPRKRTASPSTRAPAGPTVRPHELGGVVVEIPGMELVNLANEHAHWRERQRRTKTEREAVGAVLRVMAGAPPTLPAVVCITRIGPRKLDDDGATASAKGVRDAVAVWLGVDDRTPLIEWHVAQERGAPRCYGVRIEVVPVRAWSTAAVSSRVAQRGVVTEVTATLGPVALVKLGEALLAMARGERSDVKVNIGATRLGLHALAKGG